MSEELKANSYTKSGDKFGIYEFYNIGKTNLTELKKYKIIPDIDYSLYKNTMPDALLVDRRNNKNPKVVAVIEFKNFDKFDSNIKRNNAFEQSNTYAQLLNAKFAIATDTKEFYYINPNSDEITYQDQKGFNRSYGIIKNEDGYDLSINFPISADNNTEIEKSIKLINRIVASISKKTSQLNQEKKINPKNLAKNVWQSIWLASGENPDKCLSTFIEIFIFRFLSDLGILTENDNGVFVSFEDVLNLNKNKTLKYYFTNVRSHIKYLFPEGDEDGTSIINGFVLDPNIEEHNSLFFNILKSFDRFLKDEHGQSIKLSNIEPEFKSRIYEDFLKKSISQKNWGQYFTPRSIVKAIIEISNIENLPNNSVVGDPACGVGGFLLEPLLSKRSSDFKVIENNLTSKLIYKGYDRDPKVIILAKANMLIHLTEILSENRTLTKEIAGKINSTFLSFHSSILGSLIDCSKDEYDLILSNPPYVTKGVSNYKDAIKDNGILTDYYSINGMGVESFFIEKIVNSLKSNGKAFVVIPDGLLNRVHENKLRRFISQKCIIDCIISLPIGAFYSTLKKTYILGITKKESGHKQTTGVFSYLISDIGESLDIYRSPITENDLTDMVRQYKYFTVNKEDFNPVGLRCKVFPFSKFSPTSDWCVDKWWNSEEKICLGIEDSIEIVDVNEFKDQTVKTAEKLEEFKIMLEEINQEINNVEYKLESISLSSLFQMKQGNAYYTLKIIRENSWQGDIPVYSSNTKNNGVLVKIEEDKIKEKDKFYDYCLTWAVDGTSAGQLFLRNNENKQSLKTKKFLFTCNNHCGVMIPREKIDFYLNWYSIGLYEDYSLKMIHNYFNNLLDACPQHYYDKICELLSKIFVKNSLDGFNKELFIENFLDLNFKNSFVKDFIITTLLPFSSQFFSDRINIDLDYIKRNIQPMLFQRTRSYRNHKVGTGQIVDIEVNIPLNDLGAFDIQRMEELSYEQSNLEKIKSEMVEVLTKLSELNVIL